jgi:ABC-2 type transport system permease protein
MLALILKTIKEKRSFFIILCIVSIVTLWMFVALFPTVSKQSAEYEKLLGSFPKELWEIFGIKNGNLSMSTLEKYVSVEMFSLLWPILNISFFISVGVSLIAGEIDKGTIEILLSLPVSRLKMFFAKYLGGALLIAALCFVSIYSIIPIAKAYDITYRIEVYHKLFLTGLLFSLSGYSVVILLSVIFEKGRAILLGTGIYLMMYIMPIIGSLKDSLKDLQYFSFFHYLDAPQILSENQFNENSILVFSLVTVICTILAAYIFHKRDISV